MEPRLALTISLLPAYNPPVFGDGETDKRAPDGHGFLAMCILGFIMSKVPGDVKMKYFINVINFFHGGEGPGDGARKEGPHGYQ